MNDKSGSVEELLAVIDSLRSRVEQLECLERSADDPFRAPLKGERHLADFTEQAPAAIFSFDREATVLTWNPAAERIYGYSPERAVGSSLYDLIMTAESGRQARDVIREVFSGKSVNHIEWNDRNSHGVTGWRSGAAFPVFNEDGSVHVGIGINIDITEQKEAQGERVRHRRGSGIRGLERMAALEEENLRLGEDLDECRKRQEELLEKQRLLETVTSEVPVVLFAIDRDGRILFMNGRGARVANRDLSLIQGESVFEIYEGRKEFLQMCRESLSGGAVRKIITINNSSFDVMLSPVKDPEGKVSFVVGMSNDITPLSLVEKALMESEEKYRRLAENARDMIYRLSLSGIYDYVSPSSREITGYSPEEWYGSPELLRETIHPDFREYFQRAWSKMVKGEVAPYYEYRIIHKSGEIRWVRQRNVMVRNEQGESVAIEGVISDITERKHSEEQLKKIMARLSRSNEDLEEFASAASHDLQEPLMVITNFLQIIMEDFSDRIDGKGKDYMRYTIDAAERMRGLLNGLMEYSRITTRVHFRKDVPVKEVIMSALENMDYSIKKHNAEIVTDFPDEEVSCDPYQIARALQNLISNSLKFCDRERPCIVISASRSGKFWTFTVQDNGIGISEEDHARIFQIFQRAHGIGEYEGVGVGLAMVRKIVDRHGGTVKVASRKGEGSTFSFTLPVRR
jgi:PAS domain S-box-containing protein